MQTAGATQADPALTVPHLGQRRLGDAAFKWFTLLMALSVFVLVLLVGVKLAGGSQMSLHKFGWRFLISSDWDPVHEKFGALPFIFGTLVSSLIALLIAVPLSVATAVFLTELAPRWMRQPLTIFIELLAAVPSVILGLWGFYVMVPWLAEHLYPFLRGTFGYLPIFQGRTSGSSMLAGGMILAVMIVPIITSVSREILRSVPGLQREAAYALGATRWEVTRLAVLKYAKKGIYGAVILGLGRALGETMAVAMVIGNRPTISANLLDSGATLSSWVAMQFNEATEALYLSSLFDLGLVLLGVTVLVNALAQLLLKTFAGPTARPHH
jgi:phosphate transport system permease protein